MFVVLIVVFRSLESSLFVYSHYAFPPMPAARHLMTWAASNAPSQTQLNDPCFAQGHQYPSSISLIEAGYHPLAALTSPVGGASKVVSTVACLTTITLPNSPFYRVCPLCNTSLAPDASACPDASCPAHDGDVDCDWALCASKHYMLI